MEGWREGDKERESERDGEKDSKIERTTETFFKKNILSRSNRIKLHIVFICTRIYMLAGIHNTHTAMHEYMIFVFIL